LQSLGYPSTMKHWGLERQVGIYTYLGSAPSVSKPWAPWLSLGGARGIPGGGGANSVEGAPVPDRLQCVCRFFAVTFWQGRQLSVWLPRSIAGCDSITSFICLCQGDSTPCYFSSWTVAWGFLSRYCVSSIVAHRNPPFAILAKFKARHMSDCSSCTRPPSLAIIADMLITYKKSVAASKSDIQLLPLPYVIP